MTLDDTKKLLMAIDSIYPSFNVENPIATAETWTWALSEYPASAVMAALQVYIKSNNTGFAPSVSQLIGCMYKTHDNSHLSEGEAWALVKKAIQNGNYGSEEEFEKLPPLVKRAVGNSNMIRQWAMSETDEVNTVVASNFQRTYRTLLEKQRFNDRVPQGLAETAGAGFLDFKGRDIDYAALEDSNNG